MIVGIVKEVLFNEKRVAITPDTVKKLTDKGIDVLIEKNAGESAGFSDNDFIKNGAEMVNSADKIYKDRHFGFNFWKWNLSKFKCQKDPFTQEERIEIFNMMKSEWNLK